MIVENTKYFTLYIISNDTGVVLTAPTNATVWIADSDCELSNLHINFGHKQ